MLPVNWNTFTELPGAPDTNFEMLCRALVRRHYGQRGHFAALAAQPGVEFHLKLRAPCALGNPGDWYGWQCRWYELPSGRAIGSARRRKILEAIATTERVLPELTDWVLWTRHPLTAGDQAWFNTLKTPMRLHLWTAAEVDEHLSGDAEIFRSTYFGQLVFTPDALLTLHKASVASILTRWQPVVHQAVDAERAVRQILAENGTWSVLPEIANRLNADIAAVLAGTAPTDSLWSEATTEILSVAREAAAAVARCSASLARGDLDVLTQELDHTPTLPSQRVRGIPRRFRSARNPAGLTTTNLLASIDAAIQAIRGVEQHLAKRLVAILADAGCGKTQLAAQISLPTDDRPAGVLLHGRTLHSGHSLDDLAHSIVIYGRQVDTMDALLAAVDAAGQRAHRRLPIVIDGLNEAEDPRDWKRLLASLSERLHAFPYVLVVCTLRTAFAAESLPPGIMQLEIPDFAHDTIGAIRKYFKYYRINATDVELPALLRHPLTLRLFCEVTNAKRDKDVGIEAMPGSLTAICDRYLQQVAERIAELASHTHRYYEHDVHTAIRTIGSLLWEQRARSLERSQLRRHLGDDKHPWGRSIVFALEQDGVLLQEPGEAPTGARVAVLYDALAGHIVADAILSKIGRSGINEWLANTVNRELLVGEHPDRHPLADDIFRALAGLMPRRLYGGQLWPFFEEQLRSNALVLAANLESMHIDAETVAELRTLVAQPPVGPTDLLRRLHQTRGSRIHPLNADFLDSVLRPLNVADRDLRWTEWIRKHEEDVLGDLRRIETRWRNLSERSQEDRLRALWVMWNLTSTVRLLRDQATRSLYYFGRGDAAALFKLTLDSLSINDPYVSERMLAASYGVAMAHQLPNAKFGDALACYLAGLQDALTGTAATSPTNDWLARLHVQGTVTFARRFYPGAVPGTFAANERVPFARGISTDPIPSGDPREAEVDRAIQMDFENYTVGRLFRDRGNYDMRHTGYLAALAHIKGVIWVLGWRKTSLGVIDDAIASHRSRMDRPTTERYGKKYSWIGFYTSAGILTDEERFPVDERLPDIGVDPSFPEQPPTVPIAIPQWARPTPSDDRRWIRHGVVRVPDELLYRHNIGSYPGPWVAVHGYLRTDCQSPGRSVFGILKGLLVAKRDVDRLEDVLNTKDYPGNHWLPNEPSDYYVFAGEIPWNPHFAQVDLDEPMGLYRRAVDTVDGHAVEVEILAHDYAWEDYHSKLNTAGGSPVPSRPFSEKFDLRGIPQSFGQALPDGSMAVLSLDAPAGYKGHLLYMREDLVHHYAGKRQLVWFMWGERQIEPFPYPTPSWVVQAARERADIWRYVRRAEELCPAFAAKCRRPARKLPRQSSR